MFFILEAISWNYRDNILVKPCTRIVKIGSYDHWKICIVAKVIWLLDLMHHQLAVSHIQTHRCTRTHIWTPSHTLNIIIKGEIFWSPSKYWGRQLSPFDIFSLPGYICAAIFTYAGISVVCQFSLWGYHVCWNDARRWLHIWQGKCLIFAWTKLMWVEYVSYLSW